MLRKPKYPPRFQIFVMALDVGIGVVEHIVLHLPIVHISGQNVHAAAHYFIDPFFGGIGTVIGIVHNVHANTGHSHTHYYGKKQLDPPREIQGQHQEIGGKVQ